MLILAYPCFQVQVRAFKAPSCTTSSASMFVGLCVPSFLVSLEAIQHEAEESPSSHEESPSQLDRRHRSKTLSGESSKVMRRKCECCTGLAKVSKIINI